MKRPLHVHPEWYIFGSKVVFQPSWPMGCSIGPAEHAFLSKSFSLGEVKLLVNRGDGENGVAIPATVSCVVQAT